MNLPLLSEELEQLKNKNLYRKLRDLQPVDSVHAKLSDRDILLFCGNDYLGLTRHPRVIEAFRSAAAETGTGSGAARLISGNSPDHIRLEKKIAEHKMKEAALLFSAGYLANLGVLSGLAGEGDLILMDKLCHASIVDGARLSGAEVRAFPHKNYERAEEILKSSTHKKKILVSDTVFSMDGDIANHVELARLKKTYGALLIMDDAHVTGVFPPAPADDADVIVGTLSKGVGVIGGFAAASASLIEYLVNFSRPFIFATALPPAVCRAAAEALDVINEEPVHRKKLWQNTEFLKKGFENLGIEMPADNASPILPVLIGPEEKALKVSEGLLEQGILVPAIRYPTVAKGKARLRVTVSAAHSPEDLKKLLEALRKVVS